MKRYRTGIVGVGFIGKAHIEALRRLGNVDVVALTNTSRANELAESLHIARGYTDFKEMIDKEHLDVIHICTPNYTHSEIALYAMNHGVNVVCEKPMCTSVEEADAMIAKAKETKLMNGLNYHNRWYPMTAQIKEMVQAGKLGSISVVYGEFVQDWLLYDTDYNWRIEASQSGKTRAVSDIGTHWLDLIENVTNLKVTEVCADFMILHDKRKKPISNVSSFDNAKNGSDSLLVPVDTEDHASLMFRLNNGALGCAVFSQIIAGRKARLTINIAGHKQSVTWSSDTCNEIWIGRRGEYNSIFDKDPNLLYPNARVNASYPAGHAEGFPDAFKNSFRAMYNEISNPTENPAYANFDTGKHEIVLCEKIYESAKTRKWVKV